MKRAMAGPSAVRYPRGSGSGVAPAAKMSALRKIGVPYSDEEIAGAEAEVKGKSELDVLVAYLQGLGIELKSVK